VYEELLQNMTPAEANWVLYSVTGPEFAAILSYPGPKEQLGKLLTIIGNKFVSSQAKALAQYVSGFTGPASSMYLDTRMQELRAALEGGL